MQEVGVPSPQHKDVLSDYRMSPASNNAVRAAQPLLMVRQRFSSYLRQNGSAANIKMAALPKELAALFTL
ncbi:MAG: hypothetical protein ABWY00_03460 [Dongiaceae bacterium]